MTNYNFDNFDDYDFELLCCDLLNEEQRINVRTKNKLDYKHILSFSTNKRGKDKGIDLYFENEGYKVIGQCYLHGIMEGEVLRDSSLKVETITLV